MANGEAIETAVISHCRVVPSALCADGMERTYPTFGIRLAYTDGTELEFPDVSPRWDEAACLADRLCGQDVGADMVPYVVYDFLCSL